MVNNILVVGASGIIGRALLARLCSTHPRDIRSRVVLLKRRELTGTYEIILEGYVDLTSNCALAPWLNTDLDVVVFLAGVSSNVARQTPKLSFAIYLYSFVELLNWAVRFTNPPKIIYASSTAVRTAHNKLNTYSAQKLAAEAALNASGIHGAALRFPTAMPRSNDPTSPSYFLNEAFNSIKAKKEYVWPVHLDRRIRLMSSHAAANHIMSAIQLPLNRKPVTLELPATVATPRKLCNIVGAPSHCRIVSIIPEIDTALANRPVHIECNCTLEMGFNQEESLDELVNNVTRYN